MYTFPVLQEAWTRRWLAVVALLSCLGPVFGQSVRVEAVVVDAQTGEPLPYASVRASGGEGTVTNHEGRFFLDVEKDESVAVSYVGYEKTSVAAQRIGRQIRMKPFARQLSGVVVQGEKGFLSRIANHCEKSLRRNSDVRSNFFFRQLTRNNGVGHELTEAFFDGQCAYGLRNLKLVNGRTCLLAPHSRLGATILNFHLSMQVVPVASRYSGEDYSVPLVKNAPKGYLDRYDISYDRLVGRDSSEVLLLHFKACEWVKGSILEGDLYVDGRTLDLMRIDGQVKGAFLTTKMADGSTVESMQDVALTVSYTTRHGFSEVEAAATLAKTTYPDGTVSVSRAMMFNMGKKHFKGKKRLREQGDLKEVIGQVGTDSLFWERNEIVKRTLDEEQAVKSLAAMRLERPASAKEMAGRRAPMAQQQLLDLAANIQAFNAYYPQEDIYVHTDHDGYMPGETMWLSAVVQRSDNHRPSNLSQMLHIDLIDEGGERVLAKRYRLSEGYLDTGVELPKGLREGVYTLRAYTHYQLNWGERDVYERPLAVRRHPDGGQEPLATPVAPAAPRAVAWTDASSDSLLLLLLHSGNVMKQQIAPHDSIATLVQAWANDPTLQSGYSRVAALDAGGDVRLDTVVCRQLAWRAPQCEVVSPKGRLTPFCKVTLRLKGEPQTSYLLCVTDADREFGPRQQPYHQWLQERTLRHADGTLRHDLKTMSGRQRFLKNHLPEAGEFVRGRVLDAQGKPVGNVKLVVRAAGHETTVKTSAQGLFAADLQWLGAKGQSKSVSLWVANAKLRKKLLVQLFHDPQLRPDSTAIDCNREWDLMLERGWLDREKAGVSLYIPSLGEWLMTYDDDFSVTTELPPHGGEPQQHLTYRNRPVIWVVDGWVATEPPAMNEARTLRIQKDNVDVTRYQLPPETNRRRPVVVSVETFSSLGVNQKGARHLYHLTPSRKTYFRYPLYGQDPPEHDTRRTLYWNPIVNTDEQGEAVVEFSNNESCTMLNIRVE